MKFCPLCGTPFEPEARFCHECGFDKTKVLIVGTTEPSAPKTVDESVSNQINTPLPVASAPESTPALESLIPQTPPEPDISPEPIFTPPFQAMEPVAKRIEKKKLIRLALLIIGVGALGAVVWLGYKGYSSRQKVTSTDSIATMATREIPSIDTTSLQTEVTEQPETEIPAQPQAKTTKPSSIDKELARQKVTNQNKPTQKTTPAVQQTKPAQVDKTIPKTQEKNVTTSVIFEVGRSEEPKHKNPKTPTKFTIRNPTMIVRITTDHYNDGMGTPRGGTISIKDKSGYVIGIFKAIGRSGKNGTPSAKWIVEPNVVLDKGTYYLWDSDMPTWSKNLLGNGFVVIDGYEVNETD